MNESGLPFDLFESEVDMQLKIWIPLRDENLSCSIDVGNSIQQSIQILTGNSFIVLFKDKLKG
jgi:hypothetical protein